jgi:hypothetical protein
MHGRPGLRTLRLSPSMPAGTGPISYMIESVIDDLLLAETRTSRPCRWTGKNPLQDSDWVPRLHACRRVPWCRAGLGQAISRCSQIAPVWNQSAQSGCSLR